MMILQKNHIVERVKNAQFINFQNTIDKARKMLYNRKCIIISITQEKLK